MFGGLTPDQVKEILLQEDKRAAEAEDDGTERARLVEFAKFISPELLVIGKQISSKIPVAIYDCYISGLFHIRLLRR